jgi:signal transduction histidine kinase
MEIRKKLTLQFCGLAALIMILSTITIYFSFARYRQDEFYDRLQRKAEAVAQMLIDIEEVDIELLRKIEDNNPTSLPNEKIIIFDYNNEILYNSDENNLIRYSASMLDQVRLNGSLRFRQEPYEALGIFYTGRYDRFVALAAAVDIYGMQKLRSLQIILLFTFCISLVIIYLAGRIFSGRATKPIKRVMDQVDKISISSLDARVDEGNGKDEMARLGKTFNKMLERLESAFKMQKDFIANASHELRTPMTAITGQLEVVLMSTRNEEEYKKTLTSVLEDIKNLGTISNKLLLLAQASDINSKIFFSDFRIDDAIWQARSEILKRNPCYQILIKFEEHIDDEKYLRMTGNETLMKIALANLMENGCKYSHDQTVELILEHDENHIIMNFRDQGIGIPEDDLHLVFQPFYRGKNATEKKGHGIGLSLVDKIVSLHHGQIVVESQLCKGSLFRISLPVNQLAEKHPLLPS